MDFNHYDGKAIRMQAVLFSVYKEKMLSLGQPIIIICEVGIQGENVEP